MRIGIDFDNTIVCYDALFCSIAADDGLIPAGTVADKLGVRDFLRRAGQEERWTEMQGQVYGARILEAEPFPGVLDFLVRAQAGGNSVYIVSHKTRYPFRGPAYDLHEAARGWIKKHLVLGGVPLLADSAVFFEETKAAKLNRISSIECDVFVDDLPEILLADDFPARCARVLFDPMAATAHKEGDELRLLRTWQAVGADLAALTG